jgi:hypothetical protein
MIKTNKKVKNLFSFQTFLVWASFFTFLVTQIFSPYSVAAEPVLDPALDPQVPVTNVDPDSTQSGITSDSVYSQNTESTQWLADENPISLSTSGPGTIINGAYDNAELEVQADGSYIIRAYGEVFTPQDEVRQLRYPVSLWPGLGYDQISTEPRVQNCTDLTFSNCSYSFAILKSEETVSLHDYLAGRYRWNYQEAKQTLPNFVKINEQYVPLTVTLEGVNPLGWPLYDVTFTVPTLRGDGKDKIKFLAPYPDSECPWNTCFPDSQVLYREYAINHNATMWGEIEDCSKWLPACDDGSTISVVFLFHDPTVYSEVGRRFFSTDLPAGTKILDYYFSPDGKKFIIHTDKETVTIDVEMVVATEDETKNISPTTVIQAPSNSNFSFGIVDTGAGKELYLRDQRIGKWNLITTVGSDETLDAFDVDPNGRYALVNVQRTEGNSGLVGYRVTGNLLIYDIAHQTLVTPAEIIGEYPGGITLEGRVAPILGVHYRFVDGFALFNMTLTYGTGHGNITSNWGIVLNLDIPGIRYTRAPVTQIFHNGEILYTPQEDKLLFGVQYHGPGANGVGIYDIASGVVAVQPLPNYGIGGIKAVSPTGEYAIVAGALNTVYVVPIRDLNQQAQVVFIPVPTNQSSSDYNLVEAKFVSNTTAELTLENGERYLLDITTLQLTKLPPLQITAIVNNFYGGALPQGAVLISSTEIKNASGETIEWKIKVRLNRSTVAGVIQKQVLTLKKVNGQWRLQEVKDRDYLDTLIARNAFVYNEEANLRRIDRYNRNGNLLSSIYVRRAEDGTSYYEIKTVTGKRKILSINTPLYIVLREAAELEGISPTKG